jgi:hypothetical protein
MSHLSNFNKINFTAFVVVATLFILAFRFDSSSLSNLFYLFNMALVNIYDFIMYILSLVAVYIIAAYLYIKKFFAKLLDSSFTNLNTIQNYRSSLNTANLRRANFTSSVSFSDISSSKLVSEALMLKKMFSLKQMLDVKVEFPLRLSINNPKYTTDIAFYVLDDDTVSPSSELSNSISSIESSYATSIDFKDKFIKANLSDLEVSSQSKDAHLSLLLENSIESTFAAANSSR